jgi:hypothetical protein
MLTVFDFIEDVARPAQEIKTFSRRPTHSKDYARRLVAVLARRADRTVIAALPTTGAEIVQGQVVSVPNEPAMMIQPPEEEQEHQQQKQQHGPVSVLSLLRHHDTEHDDVRTARTFLRDLYLMLQKIVSPRPEEPLLDWMMTALATIGPSVPVIVAEWMELYLDHVHVVAASSSSSSRSLSTTTTTTTTKDQQAQTWSNSSSQTMLLAELLLAGRAPLPVSTRPSHHRHHHGDGMMG